jgi:regulator of replication initiation timing
MISDCRTGLPVRAALRDAGDWLHPQTRTGVDFMRKLLGIGAVGLGIVGALLCAGAIGIGWWAAVRTSARLDRAAARLDRGLSDLDVRLARVESRLNVVRTDVSAVREAAEAIVAENPDLPRVRAEIERLLDRLAPTLDRADALADSLRAGAAGLRTAADIVDQFNDDSEAIVRIRNAADKIDRGAELLDGLGAKVEALKAVKAVQLTRALVTLAREAAAGSERLAEGLTATRKEIAVVRERTGEWRDQVVTWIYVAATASTLFWLWGGLGQMCLTGCGRRCFKRRAG